MIWLFSFVHYAPDKLLPAENEAHVGIMVIKHDISQGVFGLQIEIFKEMSEKL